MEKFSTELAAEYDVDKEVATASSNDKEKSRVAPPPRIAVRCLAPGFVATKMSRIRSKGWLVPQPERYVRSSLRALECRCGCNPWTGKRGASHRTAATGWLTNVVSTVLDSPASPFSSVTCSAIAGDDNTIVTGYLLHTIMVSMMSVHA